MLTRHAHSQTPGPSDRDRIELRREPGVGGGRVRTLGFGRSPLLGRDRTLWTWPPALQIFLFPFQGSVCPCLSSLPWSRFSLTLLCLPFLLLESWRSDPSAYPSLSTPLGPLPLARLDIPASPRAGQGSTWLPPCPRFPPPPSQAAGSGRLPHGEPLAGCLWPLPGLCSCWLPWGPAGGPAGLPRAELQGAAQVAGVPVL